MRQNIHVILVLLLLFLLPIVSFIGCGGGGGDAAINTTIGGEGTGEGEGETDLTLPDKFVFKDVLLPVESSTQYFSCEFDSQVDEYKRKLSNSSYPGFIDETVLGEHFYDGDTLLRSRYFDFDSDGNFLFYGEFSYDTIEGDSEFSLPFPQPVIMLPKIVEVGQTYTSDYIQDDYELDGTPYLSDSNDKDIEITFHKETITVPQGIYDTYAMTIKIFSRDLDPDDNGETDLEIEVWYLIEGFGVIKFEEEGEYTCGLK